MALDSIMLKIVTLELKELLIGARIDRIYMPARDIVILHIRNEYFQKRLILSARSGMSRMHITEAEYENPLNPPSFCMLLRKHLLNGRIKDIRDVDRERIILIDFEVINEKGDRTEMHLSVEMMGRYSNIVLFNKENRIIDAIKHINDEMSDKRRILAGIQFEMPQRPDKLPFLSSGTDKLVSAIGQLTSPLSTAILAVTAGIGPVVCREIAFAVSETDKSADLLNSTETAKLYETIESVKEAATLEGKILSIVYENETPIEYSFIPLKQYEGLKTIYYDSVSTLLDSYYSERERLMLLKARSTGLQKQINTILDRIIRRQHSREEELNSTEKADKAKLYGELITVYQRDITKGMTSASLLNYYDDSLVDVPLDPQKTPIQNASRYYRDYRKLTTAQGILQELLEEGKKEIEYLETVKYEADTASSEEEFQAIRQELHQAGYLRSYRAPKSKARKIPEFYKYRTSDGLSVLVGRNNTANDKLTLKTAAKHDIWFHVKDGAGSHTVLVTESTKPSDTAMTEAAMIAAFHSSHSMDGQTAVAYTEIRNVKKAVGQKTGMVIYTNYKTVYVIPDREKVMNLREES